MSKKASVSHDEWMIEELRRDPKFAAKYLKQSMADMSEGFFCAGNIGEAKHENPRAS